MKGQFCLLAVASALLVWGCGENKLTQCEQIYRIAQGVTQGSKNVSYTNEEELNEMKTWLETARMMERAANQIQALHINNISLIEHQNKLATVYHIYSQATYNAVQARESKDLSALKLARTDAQKAGEMQQEVIKELNAYCLNK